MAYEYKLDIYGTTLTRGVSTNRLDRARRFGIIRNVPALTNAWAEAFITVIVNNNPHPYDGTFNLPLASVTLSRFGQDKMFVTLDYFRRAVSIQQPQGQLIARIRSGPQVTSQWYSDDSFLDGFGVPHGPAVFDGPSNLRVNPPKAHPYTRATLYLSVPYTLVGTSAAPNVANLVNHVNGTAITFNGYNFPAGSVLFTGFTEDWIEGTGGFIEYVGTYDFWVDNGNWAYQEAVFTGDSSSSETGTWEVINRFDKPTADFVGAFQG